MTFDVALQLAGAILTAQLIVLLLARRVFRALPFFIAYESYTFITSLAGAWVVTHAPEVYRYSWAPYVCLDLILYLCVLTEVGKSVLIRNRAGNAELLIPALVFPCLTVLFWALAPWPNLPRSEWVWEMNFRALQATTVLQMSGLVTLALWSSIRKLRWPERELHVVTGIVFWAPVEFAVLILHTHGIFGGRYRWLDLLTPAGTILATVYWLNRFWLEPGRTAMHGERNTVAVASLHGRGRLDPLTISRIM